MGFCPQRRPSPMILPEVLEQRVLLSANGSAAAMPNLSVGLGAVKLPTAIIAGKQVKGTAHVIVDLANGLPKGQRIDVGLFFRPETAVDGSQDISAGPVIHLVGLTPGKPKTANAKISVSGSLNGSYHLVAKVDPANQVAETDESDNEAVGQAVYNITPASTDFAVISQATTFTAASRLGDSGTVTVAVQNEGNAQGNQLLVFQLWMIGTDNGSHFVTLRPAQAQVHLKPGASKTFRLKAALPASLSDDTYTLAGRVIPSNGTGDSDFSNNAVNFSGLAIAVNGSAGGGLQLSNFRVTSKVPGGNGFYHEEGSVTVGGSESASYQYTLSFGVGILGVIGDPDLFTLNSMTFHHGDAKTLSGKTLTILSGTKGATGTADLVSYGGVVGSKDFGTVNFRIS